MNSTDSNKIIDLLVNAENNKIGISEMLLIMKGISPPKGDLPEFSINLEEGFRVVLTIEQHPGGWMRHVSVSTNKQAPTDEEIWKIIDRLGFSREEKFHSYIECGPGIESKNIIQPY